MSLNLKREPSLLYIGLLAPFGQLLTVLFPLAEPYQTICLAGLPAVAGVLVALLVSSEKLVPAILGFAQAVLAVTVAAGLDLTDGQQASLLAFVGTVVAVVVRDRVLAPAPAVDPVELPPVSLPGVPDNVSVRDVQTALGVEPVDGVYGPVTSAAVRDFQRAFDLDDDGLIGPGTLEALRRVHHV